ncbi:putative disease resistance protein [Vitis vinifera]|uniref:Putative disease resistance protein n=1 Tax=Vitis vinifera TaxID=29760 RepID=A0A438GZD6_VITVI|nr:putative disease resistance protein [Vitis vinifera]
MIYLFFLHFSLYKIRKKLEELNRKKDVVCLILSYPPFNSRNIETHRGWIRDVLEINHKASEALNREKQVNISDLSSKITGLLHHSIHDIEAHVPSHILVEMCVEMCEEVFLWYPTPNMATLNLCIDDFMIRQILQNIQISEIQSILISGVNDKTFLCRLKNLPPIRQMFDLVIQVNVKSCLTSKDIEDRIIEELGFSKSSRGEAEQLLRSQNFLILLDDFDPWMINLHDLGNGWWNSDNTQKIVSMCFSSFSGLPVADLEIWGNYHLLSWKLFCENAGEVMSSIQQLAVHLLRQCSGHLLATVLMARALKDAKNVRIWQHASRVIGCLPTSHAEDRILFNALAFILGHLGSANKCVKYCASHLEMEGTKKVDLLDSWMNEDLIETLDEGEKIVQHLVNALLLESFQNGESIQMRKEIRKELVNFYEAEMNPILLVELDGRGLMEAPKNETWEEANEMHLMNNKISKLLDNPNCPKLIALFLQGNHHLRVISPSFFQCMPMLQILDLSQTKIKSLPQSLFKLIQLRKFILRSCELFSELPVEVGEFCHLEVLDLEGTEIINLPVAIGKLTNLTCLKVSFYPQANGNRKNNMSNRIIPQNVISNLLQLEELSIDVNPEDERWNATIKDIVEEIYCGNHLKRIISRLPHESAIKFEEQESCLKYMNGKGIPIEIKEKCSEIETIVDTDDLGEDLVLESLEYLSLHYMKNLRSIWKGPLSWYLPNLKKISLHYLPKLVSIFGNVPIAPSLEWLSFYDCPSLKILFPKEVSSHKLKVIIGEADWWSALNESEWFKPQNLGAIFFPIERDIDLRTQLAEINDQLQAQMQGTKPSQQSEIHKQRAGKQDEGDVNEDTVTVSLRTIFTLNLLENLNILEELVIEDCPEINSLVTCEFDVENEWFKIVHLPSLKKMSPYYMSKLVSISRDWGCARPDNLDSVFVPINGDVDLITRLSRDCKTTSNSKTMKKAFQLDSQSQNF